MRRASRAIARGDKATLRLATLLQMTYPGTPCVYYGDEIALRGTKRYDHPHRDLDARWPFPWHDESVWDREMLSYFREVIALRARLSSACAAENSTSFCARTAIRDRCAAMHPTHCWSS